MEIQAGQVAKSVRKVVFHRVAENLYRLEMSGGYYALVKRGDKQFRRSLRTKDRKLADRRLSEFLEQVGRLDISDDAHLTFDEIGQRWLASISHSLKPSTTLRRSTCLKNLGRFFVGLKIRNISAHQCERWLTERAGKIAPQTMVHELNAMRGVFDYAARHGLVITNPAQHIKPRKIVLQRAVIPTREQFRQLIEAIRNSDGRAGSQKKAQPGADFVELLAYSGCRLNEAASLRWADVNFEGNLLTVTGGEKGTKNHETRTIPITDALRALLLRIRGDATPLPSEKITQFGSARKCLLTAARRLGLPEFSHHDFRHFFATTCIESGVDIPTVSRWLGHKDGGALAMRVYGHLRQEHSNSMVKRVSF